MRMNNQNNDMVHDSDMPSTFEELEIRRALNKKRIEDPDVDKEWAKFAQTLEEEELEEPYSESGSKSHRKFMLAFLSGVAATVLCLLILYPSYRNSSSIEVFTANHNTQDIMIKSEEGDLTKVKNGKTLSFNQETVSSVNNSTHKVKMMELSTPRGKDCKVTLPDGSQVWLNAESKISFPDKFIGKERKVRIEGEAFFQVVKDTKHPFIVSTDFFSTTVHGTSFNVNAYSAKTASVTLVTGSVTVRPTNGEETMIEPGEMAICDAQGNTQINKVDTYPVIQWKDGFFYFDNECLIDIMMELGRWYNVSIVFEHEEDMNLRLHFVAEHKESLKSIVERINDLGIAKLKIDKDCISVE